MPVTIIYMVFATSSYILWFEILVLVANAMVSSWFENCNSLFYYVIKVNNIPLSADLVSIYHPLSFLHVVVYLIFTHFIKYIV